MKLTERGLREMQRRCLKSPVTANGPTPYIYTEGIGRWGVMMCVVKDMATWNGEPSWVAQVERPNALGDGLQPYVLWTAQQKAEAIGIARDLLHGVGRISRERIARDNQRIWLARCTNGEEWEALSVAIHDADPVGHERGPVSVIDETWQSRPAAYPCLRPKRVGGELDWIAEDCGECTNCLDRKGLMSERQRVRKEKELEEEYMRGFNQWKLDKLNAERK